MVNIPVKTNGEYYTTQEGRKFIIKGKFVEAIYVLMNEESKEALKKYNLEALQKFQNRKV